jgi:hypothetical protein
VLLGKLTLGEFSSDWSNNKYIVDSVLYGEMYTPLFFFNFFGISFFAANLNPFGSIKIPPHLNQLFSISPNLFCLHHKELATSKLSLEEQLVVLQLRLLLI